MMNSTTVAIGSEGGLLLEWLALLGWQISSGRDGGLFVGHGIYLEGDTLLRIDGCARSRGQLAWQLFEAGCATISRHRQEQNRRRAA